MPSSSEVCDICSTQCFPGIASLANATDVGPSCIIFSGSRSKFPSPAYCKIYPDVTRTNILCVHSVLLMDPDIFRECFFSSFFLAPLSLFWASSLALLPLLLALIRKIESADNVGAKRQACLIDCGYAWKRGGGSQEVIGGQTGLSFWPLVFGVCVVGDATNVGVETVVEAAVVLAGECGKSDA